jgi:predicted porin
MKFTAIALAATAIAAAAPAAAEVYTFTQDGVRFDVNETVQDGVRLIEGRDSSGATFSYKVRGTQVSGTYRGEPVFFNVSAKSQKTASR